MRILLRPGCLEGYKSDLRELLMAFFPGCDILQSGQEPSEEEVWDACLLAEGLSGGKEAVLCFETQAPESRSLRETVLLSGNRREDKSSVKRVLYRMLSGFTAQSLPWGTLTGIRPVKLAEAMLKEEPDQEKAREKMKACYLISDEKLELLFEIAEIQKELLRPFDKDSYSLYVGIPFCPTTCAYCSFTSYPIRLWESRLEEYRECIHRELENFSASVKAFGEKTGLLTNGPAAVYVGGGTPTSPDARMLDRILCEVDGFYGEGRPAEYTVEAGRPDSVTEEKLEVLKKHGVTRISINPQTMNQETLDRIGRRHTVGDVYRAFELARKQGFDNINMDLIMGLPGETLSHVEHTLNEVRRLAPESLTVHTLAVKRAARLNTSGQAWNGDRAFGEEIAGMVRMGRDCAREMGMRPYYLYRQKNMSGNQENTGYALPGKECLYNIFMMEEKQSVLAAGAGTTTKLLIPGHDVLRHENVKNVSEYMPRIEEMTGQVRSLFGTAGSYTEAEGPERQHPAFRGAD